MFSGIHSLFFGKKGHHRNHNQTVDDSAADKTSSENDFVVLERRHSDDPDINPGLYPKINPSFPGGNLPYGISPSLPDVRPESTDQKTTKEATTVDLLHGVPFELASYIDIMTNEKDEKFARFLQRTEDVLTEEVISDGYSYDFNLEHRILSEFRT